MDHLNQLLLALITILTAIIGYFVKQIFERTERTSADVAEIKPKVKILETISADVSNLKPKVRMLDRISADVADIKPKVKFLWEQLVTTSHSPLGLNERGTQILDQSGVKELVDQKLTELLEAIKVRQPQNAYQVQEGAREVMSQLKNDATLLSQLQQGAFNTGADVEAVLLVGSIYLRDLVLPTLNFKLEDIKEQ